MASKKTSGLAVAAGVAGALAAAAGAYFLYGTKEGKKTQKKIRGCALRAKGEVLEKIEKMKDVTEDNYNNAVASVMDKYKKVMKDHGDDVEAVTKELKGYWKHLKSHLKTHAGKPKSKKTK